MAFLAAQVSVKIDGIICNSGTVDAPDTEGHASASYHVTFTDGEGGWFHALQLRLEDFAPTSSSDPFIDAVNRMLNNIPPRTPPQDKD